MVLHVVAVERVTSRFNSRLAFAENLCSNKPSGSIITAQNHREDVDNIDTAYLPVYSTG